MSTGLDQSSEYIFKKWLDFAQNCFWFGALLSVIGFALPWVKPSVNRGWWYGGYDLMTDQGQLWIGFIFAGYGLLIFIGYGLLKHRLRIAGIITMLTLAIAMGAFMAISFAIAAVVMEARTFDSIRWSIGLMILLPSHASMIFGSIMVWVLRVMQESFGISNH